MRAERTWILDLALADLPGTSLGSHDLVMSQVDLIIDNSAAAHGNTLTEKRSINKTNLAISYVHMFRGYRILASKTFGQGSFVEKKNKKDIWRLWHKTIFSVSRITNL